jgi:hypothetical protein
MMIKAFNLHFSENCPLQFGIGVNAISALACSVAAELVIRCKHSDGWVWSSIPALGNNSPVQSSEILVQHPVETAQRKDQAPCKVIMVFW